MTWLIWRQHRLQLALAAALLALFAVPTIVTGVHLSDGLQACRSASSCSGFQLLQGYQAMVVITSITVLVPLVIGSFWGATIIGKELDTGTATLVWTQSVTRGRWLRAKVLTLFGSTALVSGAVAALVTWWSGPRNSTGVSRFEGLQFDIQGVAPVAYSLFAAALGLAAGVLWRRVLPAMATTIGAFVAVRLVVELFVRPHLRTPVTVFTLMSKPSEVPSGSLMISSDLTLHGRVVYGTVRAPVHCAPGGRTDLNGCLDSAGYRLRTVYQPAGRYWSFQLIEAGIFVALAVVLVAVAVIAVRRRDA